MASLILILVLILVLVTVCVCVCVLNIILGRLKLARVIVYLLILVHERSDLEVQCSGIGQYNPKFWINTAKTLAY